MLGSTLKAVGTLPYGLRVHAPEPCVDNIAFSPRDAMPECGTLTIEAANAHMDKTYAAKQRDVAPGQHVADSVMNTCTAAIAARFLNPTHLIRALVADRP